MDEGAEGQAVSPADERERERRQCGLKREDKEEESQIHATMQRNAFSLASFLLAWGTISQSVLQKL